MIFGDNNGVTEQPEKIYQQEKELLKQNKFEILETLTIEPYSEDHAVIIAKYHRWKFKNL